jgi:hypothetical protein
MVRTRRQAVEVEECEQLERVKARVADACADLVQTALKGEVQPYVIPDHTAGESFPGRQPLTTQLSLFETGFKRKSGQRSLFEAGFVRKRSRKSTEIV